MSTSLSHDGWFKVLTAGGTSQLYGRDFEWPFPKQRRDGTWRPGKWTPRESPMICERGWHLTQLPYLWFSFVDCQIFAAEWRGNYIYETGSPEVKTAFESVRLLHPVDPAPFIHAARARLEQVRSLVIPRRVAPSPKWAIFQSDHIDNALMKALSYRAQSSGSKDLYDSIGVWVGTEFPTMSGLLGRTSARKTFYNEGRIQATNRFDPAYNASMKDTAYAGIFSRIADIVGWWVAMPIIEEKLHPKSVVPINELWDILQDGYIPVGKDGEGNWIVAGLYP